MQRRLNILALTVTLCAVALGAHAAETGHFNGGFMNIRDYFVPDPGFYGAVYNYFYSTGRLNDRNGDEINSITINPRGGPGITLGVDVDVDLYALVPSFIWVSDWKILGANYGAYIAPSFTNAYQRQHWGDAVHGDRARRFCREYEL